MQLLFILLVLLVGSAVFAWWHRQRFGPLLRQVWHTIRWFWLALLVLLFLGRAVLPILATAAGAPDAAGESPPWQLVVIEITLGVPLYAGVALPFLASIVLVRRRSSPSVRPDTDHFMDKLTDSLIGGVLVAIIIMLSVQIALVAGGLIGALLAGRVYEFGMDTFNTLLGITGGVLGALSAVIGVEVTAVWRRRRQRGDAAAHAWVWGFRIGLFVIGAFIIVLPFFRDNLGPIGVIGGVFIILSLLVSTVARHPIGWTMLTLTVVCAALVPIGLGMYGLGGGPQGDNALVGIGFMMGLGGLFFFFASAFITMVIALRVYVQEWRERHGGTATPPPTTSH